MDLSVVVPTYNQADLLRESLRALLDQTLPKDTYEIVVVDDGSTDHTTAVLREFGPPVKVVRFLANRGRSAARNEGIRQATGQLVTFVDSDVIVRRDFLAWHLLTYRAHGPGVLSRGPVVLVPDVPTARQHPIPRLARSPAYLDTANAAVERSALLQAGSFDEQFPGYGWEDFELGMRLKELGIRRVFCRQAVAFHIQPPVTWANIQDLLRKEEERAKSAVYFYQKRPTSEVKLLIQATSLHHVLYSIQSGCGLLTPKNMERIVGGLRRSGRFGLAYFVQRGVLNRHYLRKLNDELNLTAVMDDAPTPMGPLVLIVSNGHGEDAVGMALVQRLRSVAMTAAFPLVGTGGAYTDVVLLEPRRALPSGGFSLRGAWGALWADLRAGLVLHWMRQRATLRRQRGRYNFVIAVGDVYCLQMAALTGTQAAFVATAKSEYCQPHRALERLFLRRHAQAIFTRDEVTADALRRAGLPARYVGNPLMDTIGSIEGGLRPDQAHPTVTILPGSRTDAYANLRPLLRMCAQVADRVSSSFFCALAPSINLEQLKSSAAAVGWIPDGEALRHGSATVTLTRAFGDSIHVADVVVGLAGTANEQAAGLGKPVVTFAGPGPQATRGFVRLQQLLLGDALVAARDWEEAAEAVVRLLRDPSERAARGEAGRRRMGEPGAIKKIAEAIVELLEVADDKKAAGRRSSHDRRSP